MTPVVYKLKSTNMVTIMKISKRKALSKDHRPQSYICKISLTVYMDTIIHSEISVAKYQFLLFSNQKFLSPEAGGSNTTMLICKRTSPEKLLRVVDKGSRGLFGVVMVRWG